METSDSECFESADEDFQSEDEDTSTVTTSTKSEELVKTKTTEKSVEIIQDKLSETKLCDETDLNKNDTIPEVAEKLPSDDNRNKLVESGNTDNKKRERKAAKKEAVSHKTKSSLGTKLGNFDKSSKVIESKSEINKNVFEEDLWGDDPNWGDKEEENGTQSRKKGDTSMWDAEEINWGESNKQKIQPISKPKPQTGDIKSETVKEEDDLWGDDDWEPLSKEDVKKTTPKTDSVNSSWGAWGNWGVTSILSTASQSVTTLTTHVSHGLNTVLESGIGVPDPEEMARINALENRQRLQQKTNGDEDNKEEKEVIVEKQQGFGFGLGNFVSGVNQFTKLVESTGTKVISGGLDTLETIGKKTMEVLQEGDPGLKKKRAFLTIEQDKPVLSQLLREAKEKHEAENKHLQQRHYTVKAKNYETLFDDHQGLVHLEALEMLSKQCDIKLQTLLENGSGEALIEMQETLEQVKELCELPDEDEDEQLTVAEIKEKLESAVSEIGIPITYKQLMANWEETEQWMNNLNIELCSETELHQQAIETLAQLTAIAVEQFHKSGELLLVKEHRSTADEADSLVQLTSTLTSFIGIVAAKFSDKLNTKAANIANKEDINGLITNVFFEAANSSSYIQDAFQLLIPVLQVGAV